MARRRKPSATELLEELHDWQQAEAARVQHAPSAPRSSTAPAPPAPSWHTDGLRPLTARRGD